MKYFLDTEFIEGTQKSIFNTKPTIDLISIGIVAEDGREYYAISKDFNLKEAWNRYDLKEIKCHAGDILDNKNIRKDSNIILKKVYWIRDNVLKPIFIELWEKDKNAKLTIADFSNNICTFKEFKRLIKKYGKTNKQIAEEIKHFVANRPINSNKEQWILDYDTKDVQFYGYYSDYDWVVFCWLFGKMIDLPKGFPMYCIDLKQTLDEKEKMLQFSSRHFAITDITKLPNFPKQTNEHNALADAKWNFELYKFLNIL